MAKKSTRMAKTVANSTPKSLSPTPEFNRSSRSKDLNGRLLTISKAAPKEAARPERITRVFDTCTQRM
ncbi:unnamed protein product [Rhodiola kirilowii]